MIFSRTHHGAGYQTYYGVTIANDNAMGSTVLKLRSVECCQLFDSAKALIDTMETPCSKCYQSLALHTASTMNAWYGMTDSVRRAWENESAPYN